MQTYYLGVFFGIALGFIGLSAAIDGLDNFYHSRISRGIGLITLGIGMIAAGAAVAIIFISRINSLSI